MNKSHLVSGLGGTPLFASLPLAEQLLQLSGGLARSLPDSRPGVRPVMPATGAGMSVLPPLDWLACARNRARPASPRHMIPKVSTSDRALFGYFGMKLATERVIEQSGIGWTTLRATQVHDLILMVASAMAKLPVIPASAGTRFQPVDAAEVAARMAELAFGEPSGLVPDLAGRYQR